MAGNPVDSIAISIYPATAIFSARYVDSLAVEGIDVTFTNSDCTVVSDHLVYNTYTSMSGANTLTITAYGHQYTISPINDSISINLPTKSLYAWTYSNYILYTDTETPTSSDKLYNANGEEITVIGDYTYLQIVSTTDNAIILDYMPA